MALHLIKRLGALSFLLSSIIASPLSTPENSKSRAGTYAITGVLDSGIEPRLEIRTLAADPIQWNLFLLAMIQYQGADQSQMLSFYQIAGMFRFH